MPSHFVLCHLSLYIELFYYYCFLDTNEVEVYVYMPDVQVTGFQFLVLYCPNPGISTTKNTEKVVVYDPFLAMPSRSFLPSLRFWFHF